jgi:radical SAM protein with 4Fe4S-binding SPASM domain
MGEEKRDGSELKDSTVLFAPSFHLERQGDLILLFKPEEPNWMATNSRGAKVLSWIDGNRTLEEIIVKYAQEYGGGISRAWLHCVTMLREAMQCGFVSTAPFSGNGSGYGGRGDILKLENLEELWLHLTNACNLECTHCLVNSSPRNEIGIPLRAWEGIIKDAIELGVRRFYVTGGEPFIRKDLGEVVMRLAEADPDKIVFLTNGTLLKGRNLQVLSKLSSKVELQISLEGPNKKINDPIRGAGSFETAVRGIKRAVEMGITPVIATTLMKETLLGLHETTRLASSLGAAYHHLFLLHRRGRSLGKKTPTTQELLDALTRAIDAADETGIRIDNYETAKHRVAEGRGVKRDLSSAAWSSLCIYWDGRVFPSASLAGIKTLDMGSAVDNSLGEIWSSSKVGKELRGRSVVEKGSCSRCSLKFICGGGDVEYSYLYQGDFLAPDPFCVVHKELLDRAILDIAGERCFLFKKAQGAPRVFFSMLEGIGMYEKVHSLKGTAVATTPSNCVLFLDLEASREVVRDFYARAAKEPREELCCPSGYSGKETSHIPREVLKVAYGCGSPVEWAGITPGEVVVDLGSGGGIDCFVAAKAVGPRGRVIGIDMTREMLEKAEKNKKKVTEKLGYDVVEFKKGYLEEIPLKDCCADVVLSNCVINLSPDKERVFSEIWRVLKNHGRAVISDTISSEKVPLNMRMNPRLWGECVSGALTEEEFLTCMERRGFYGVSVLKKSFWRAVEGKNFYSAVIRGYKLMEKRDCRYIGQRVVYTGPFKAVMDEEGHLFPRGEEVEVCTDTAAKLRRAPYASVFRVIDPKEEEKEYRCCDPKKGGPC